MAKRISLIDRHRCVACGACVGECSKNAIAVHKGCYAVVDGEKCVGCGLCVKVCPVGCIEIKEREQNED